VAYRHIVNVMRGAGASNITWVWHLNWSDSPGDQWNHFENYYPGNDVVDLIGVSAYGPLRPSQNWEPMRFRDEMDDTYNRIEALAPGKPVIISEVGATVRNPNMAAQGYADGALRDILSHRWANVVGFSWWNERWQNDGNTTWDSSDTDMRVQDSPELMQVFQNRFGQYAGVIQETPVVG
jgi:beta-mannanase